MDNKSGLVPSNFVIDLEAVLNLRSEIDEVDQKDGPSSLTQGLARQIPSNLMTVNSS